MDDSGARSGSGVVILGEEFLTRIGGRRYSPRTVGIYRQAIRDFGRFLDGRKVRTVEEVTGTVVEDYRQHLQERGFSPAGEETYARAVKRLFDDLESRQRVFENPFDGTGPMRRARKLMPVPSESEMQALLAVPAVDTPRGLRTRALLEVAYSTGARLEELSRMRLADLDPVRGTLRILGKGNRERVVPLGKAAIEWVGRYVARVRAREIKGATAALWIKPNGRPLGPQGISRSVQECVKRCGCVTAITPHGIRRACATHMLKHGAHPVQIQMLLGHASLRLLSRYLRVSFCDLQGMHQRSRIGQ